MSRVRKQPSKQTQKAISPAFRIFDTHDLSTKFPCVRPQTHFHLHSTPSAHTHTISAEGCPCPPTKTTFHLHPAPSARSIAHDFTCIPRLRHARPSQRVAQGHPEKPISPAFRAFEMRDLGRRLRAPTRTRASTCNLHHRHRRSPEGGPRPLTNAISPAFRTFDALDLRMQMPAVSLAFRAFDTHDLRRGVAFRLTSVPPPANG